MSARSTSGPFSSIFSPSLVIIKHYAFSRTLFRPLNVENGFWPCHHDFFLLNSNPCNALADQSRGLVANIPYLESAPNTPKKLIRAKKNALPLPLTKYCTLRSCPFTFHTDDSTEIAHGRYVFGTLRKSVRNPFLLETPPAYWSILFSEYLHELLWTSPVAQKFVTETRNDLLWKLQVLFGSSLRVVRTGLRYLKRSVKREGGGNLPWVPRKCKCSPSSAFSQFF